MPAKRTLESCCAKPGSVTAIEMIHRASREYNIMVSIPYLSVFMIRRKGQDYAVKRKRAWEAAGPWFKTV